MRSARIVLALAVALLITYPVLAAPEEGAGKKASAEVNAATQEVTKVSKDGFMAMRAVREARIAIFNGEPKVAVEIMDKANKALDAASKDESLFIADMKTLAEKKAAHGTTTAATTKAMIWIPIDGQIALADSYVPTPEKKEHIAKANEHLKNGRAKEAIEELRLGEINVTYTRVLMPLTATKKCLADAMSLANEHKYYEANLALKAAEDGVILDSVGLTDDKGEPKDQTKKSSPSDKNEKERNSTPIVLETLVDRPRIGWMTRPSTRVLLDSRYLAVDKPQQGATTFAPKSRSSGRLARTE